MLKFQADADPDTNEKVLTCYLLPQADWRSKSQGQLFAEKSYLFKFTEDDTRNVLSWFYFRTVSYLKSGYLAVNHILAV